MFLAHTINDVRVSSFPVQIGPFIDEPELLVLQYKMQSNQHIFFFFHLEKSS